MLPECSAKTLLCAGLPPRHAPLCVGPDPALSMTDRSPASGRPAVGVSGEVGRPVPSAGRGMASLFQQRDRNGDGKLSRDEIPAALFDRLDANKDGLVNEDEAKALWRKKRPAKNQSDPAAAANKLQQTTAVDAAVPRNESAATPLARLVFTQASCPSPIQRPAKPSGSAAHGLARTQDGGNGRRGQSAVKLSRRCRTAGAKSFLRVDSR